MKKESDYIRGYIAGLEDSSEFIKSLLDGLPTELQDFRGILLEIRDGIFKKAQNAKLIHDDARLS
jgi:hypothetical protein